MSAFVLTAGLVAEATGGVVHTGDVDRVFDRVSSDSRTLAAVRPSAYGAGTLFLALSGPNFDGHTFVPDAIARGVAGVLVSTPPAEAGTATVIVVEDPLTALQRLGREIRRRSGAKVVAITGSAGKTTTKEATAACLSSRYRVYRNPGNLNNHIGLPLSLLDLRHGPDIAVMELGMNHAGEIRELTGMSQPDVRVWTNVGNAHIGHFGSMDAIAAAKAEILEGSTADTLVVANADDPLVMRHVSQLASTSAATIRTFGCSVDADVRATQIENRGFDGTRTALETPWGSLSLQLALAGRANVFNMMAAATVALALKVSPADVARAAATTVALDQRGAFSELANGARLVDDSYNASPAAVQAMFETLAATATDGRRIAVVGEMLELGHEAEALHEQCGRAAADAGLDVLVAVGGAPADGLVAGALAGGMAPAHVLRFPNSREAAEAMVSLVKPGDLVLVKGSRGSHTELVADRLKVVD